jgi:hypothetical protein
MSIESVEQYLLGGNSAAAPGGAMSAAPISWRKAVLLNRSALLSAWPRHFPAHDFHTLRPRSQPDGAESYWGGESWKRAARAYHEDRKRGPKVRA